MAAPWDLDNDRPADPVHAGRYTNPAARQDLAWDVTSTPD
jgi:hypothetical protein